MRRAMRDLSDTYIKQDQLDQFLTTFETYVTNHFNGESSIWNEKSI